MITKKQFEKLVDVKLFEEDSKLVCNSYLDLEGRKDITELPNNLRVLGCLNLRNSGVTKLPKGLEVKDWLCISDTDIEELPEDTKFGSSLYVSNMKKPFSFPKVLKVNGNFKCIATDIKCMPEKLYVNLFCDLSKSTFDKLPKIMEVGESLYLAKTPITELPECIKEVYNNLDVYNTKISKLNDNLVVYNELILSNTLIEELPKGLIVGIELDLRDGNLKDYSNLHKVCSEFIIDKGKYEEIKDALPKHIKEKLRYDELIITFKPNHKGAYLFENENGKYINADNIFAKIIKQKGNIYHVKLDGSKEITYLVTDGDGRWSHGYTLEGAKDDLLYKISKRNKDNYKHLSLNSKLSFENAIVCYRVITGACAFGTKDFVENRLGENKKDKYTIKEIIELTKGEYGNKTFKKFFFRG